MTALKDIPEIKKPLVTSKGQAKLQKTDIFKKIMWFGYDNENSWISITSERVKEILEMNEQGKKPDTLKENDIEVKDEVSEAINSDLERLDRKFQKKSKNKKRRKNRKFRSRNKKNIQ